MRITVLMSVLNGERYLDEAVQSILEQTFSDFEFLIINNGSTDKTASILSGYAEQDERIKIITNEKTIPLTAAREQGISLITTDWVALMDADDYAYPKRLERQLELLKSEGHKIGALGTYAYYMNEKSESVGVMKTGPTSSAQFARAMAANDSMIITDPSAIIHRQTFLDVGGYRPEHTPAGDLDLWYRIGEQGREIRALPEFLMRYRVHGGSMSVSQTMLQRMKTHFINHNMRRRRNHQSELTYDEFRSWARKRPIKRLRWYFSDLGMTYYKRAGLSYGQGHHLQFALFLGIGLTLKPSFLWKRLLPQIKNRLGYG